MKSILPYFIAAFLLRIFLYFLYPPFMTDNLEYIKLAGAIREFVCTGKISEIGPFLWLNPLWPIALALFPVKTEHLIHGQMILSLLFDISSFLLVYYSVPAAKLRLRKTAAVFYLFSPLVISTFHWSISESAYLFIIALLMYKIRKKQGVISQFFLSAAAYLARPEGIIIILPVLYINKKESFKKLLAGIAVFGIVSFSYIGLLSYYSSKAGISYKSGPLMYGAAMIFLNDQLSGAYGKDASELFQKLEWTWVGQTALSGERALWLIDQNNPAVFFWKNRQLLAEVYRFFFNRCMMLFCKSLFPLELLALAAGFYYFGKKNIILSLFLTPFIFFPLGDYWLADDIAVTRHFAYIYIVFIQEIASGFLAFFRKKAIFVTEFSAAVILAASFFLNGLYFRSFETTTYRIERTFIKATEHIDLSNRRIMVRNPWFAYLKGAEWVDFIHCDEDLPDIILKKKISHIVIDENYHYFFARNNSLIENPPDYLKTVYASEINEYDLKIYEVDASLLEKYKNDKI